MSLTKSVCEKNKSTSLFPTVIHVVRIFIATNLLFLFQQNLHALDVYVSPEGKATNSGRYSSPFASIEQAIGVIKNAFIYHPDEDCTIWLMDGVYRIENPIEILAQNLLNKKGSLTIAATSGSTPVVSGGVKITEWEQVSDGLWKAQMQERFAQNLIPRELFINNRRAIRARHPNNGYLRVAQVGIDRRTNFFFKDNSFPVPSNTKNTELVLLHDWSISRIPVKEIDPSTNKLTAIDSIGARHPAFFNLDNWEAHPRYFLENDKAFLDVEFEWYYDEDEKVIWLQLPQGQNANEEEIIIPVSQGLLELSGLQKKPLKNIVIKNIIFEHSAWNIPSRGYAGIQACHFDPRMTTNSLIYQSSKTTGWAAVPPAIKGEWVTNITFSGCTFRHFGGSGIWLGTGSANNSIVDCIVKDISGNGIMIGEGRDRLVEGQPWWKGSPEQAASGNAVVRNTISDCGVQFFGAVGVWAGLTTRTSILRNEIHGLPYTGISIGWMWSPVPTPCQKNILEKNHIHHIMQELSDGGGIYMLGLQPDSKILYNRIHDVNLNAGRAESNGLFLDEGTTDVEVSGNIIYNIAKSPLRFHRATTNTVRGNQFFCKKDVPPIQYNSTNPDDIVKEKNQVINEDDRNYQKQLDRALKKWKPNRK